MTQYLRTLISDVNFPMGLSGDGGQQCIVGWDCVSSGAHYLSAPIHSVLTTIAFRELDRLAVNDGYSGYFNFGLFSAVTLRHRSKLAKANISATVNPVVVDFPASPPYAV